MTGPIQVKLPVPFPLGTVNVWLLPGQRPAMVDCGIGTPEAYQRLHEAAREAGFHFEEATIHLTHGHVDHAGNTHRFQADHGATVRAPRDEAPFVETFRADGPVRNDQFADALRAHGMPEPDVVRMRGDSDAIDDYTEDARIDAPLQDGERLQLGDLDAQAIITPGHTPGSTCYLTEENTLFSGDTLLEGITSNAVELRDADKGRYHQYVETLESLRRFVGIRCLPGHHDPFTLTDKILDTQLDRHAARRNAILAALKRPKTAHQVMRELYPHWDSDPQRFMGMAEVVGHLHSLEIDGEAERREEDGVRRFVHAGRAG